MTTGTMDEKVGQDPAAEIVALRRRVADLEQRCAAERAAAEAEQARLTYELGHRVKNTLSVVQALASQTLREPTPRAEALETFGSRILALARANDLILGLGWTTATLGSVSERVLDSPARDVGRLTIEGPELALPASNALAFAMALHELLTNAQRHGALSRPDGRAALAWRLDPTDTLPLTLTWRESGGPEAHVPERRGFGLKLIEQSLRTAFGRGVTIDFPPDGLLCTVRAAMPATPPGARHE